MKSSIRHLLLWFLLPLAMMSCVEEPAFFPNTKIGNYDALWHLIDTRYCYLDYKAINWDSLYVVYKPGLDTVSNEVELFDLMAALLAELKDGHVNLSANFDRSRYWAWFQEYPSNFSSSVLYSDRYLGRHYRMAGGFHYTTLQAGQIGYLYYSSFSNAFSQSQLKAIFKQFEGCSGLIVDVRENGGGSLSLSEALASYFMDKKTLTGYIAHKTGDGHSAFSKPEPVYTPAMDSVLRWHKPVVVLTNRHCYSATNDFVVRMKAAPRALIMGDQTGGGGGLPLSNELPNGWMLRFSACPMYDADKQHTEWGVLPDITVSLDSLDLAGGYDTLIERAIGWLTAN